MKTNPVKETTYIFYIEAEHLLTLHFTFEKANIKIIGLEDQIKIPNFKSPYHNSLSSMYIKLSSKEFDLFLKIIENEQKNKNKVRVYKLENQNDILEFRPFIIIDSENLLLATTFFFQKLKNPRDFLKDEEQQEIIDSNYLEEMKVTTKSKNKLEGYYHAISHMPNNEHITAMDTGLFQMENFFSNGKNRVVTKITNIKNIINSYETPYDSIFGFSNRDGMSFCQMEEIYEKRKEHIIHYAENIDRIEIYEQDEQGNIKPFTVKRFSKESPKDDFEKEIVFSLEEEKALKGETARRLELKNKDNN